MSGDKARFNRLRKKGIARRVRIRALREKLASSRTSPSSEASKPKDA